MKIELFLQILEQFSNTILHENLSTGSRVVPFGQTDRQTGGHTEKTKLILVLGSFANTYKNIQDLAQKVLLFCDMDCCRAAVRDGFIYS